MPEQPDKTCFKDAELDEGLKIRAGAGDDCATAPEESSQDSATPATIEKNSESAEPERKTESGNSFVPLDNIGYKKAPYYGLHRHRFIVAACLSFAALILAVSTVDLRMLVSRPASIDKSFNIKIPAAAAQLPPNLTYYDQSWSESHDSDLDSFSEGLRPVRYATWVGEKVGFVDTSGKLVIKPKFSYASEFRNGLAAARTLPTTTKDPTYADYSNLPYGYINRSGNWVIKSQYSSATPFHDGVAAVYCKPSAAPAFSALIDTTGKELIKTDGTSTPERIGDVYIMQSGGKAGLVDKHGKWITKSDPRPDAKPDYDRIEKLGFYRYQTTYSDFIQEEPKQRDLQFENSLQAWQGGRCGIIDHSGKILIPIKYSQIVAYNNGGAVIKQGDKFGIVDSKGKSLADPKYDDATTFDDIFAVKDQNGWSVFDAHGVQVKTVKFQAPLTSKLGQWFSDGLAPVLIDGKVGFINAKGELAIPPLFRMASGFSEGLAAAWDGSSWGYIDRSGKFVSAVRFESVAPFHGGRAAVSAIGPLYPFYQIKTVEDFNTRVENTLPKNAQADGGNVELEAQ